MGCDSGDREVMGGLYRHHLVIRASLFATFKVARLTLQTRKLWLVGWSMSRPTVPRVTFDLPERKEQKKNKNKNTQKKHEKKRKQKSKNGENEKNTKIRKIKKIRKQKNEKTKI